MNIPENEIKRRRSKFFESYGKMAMNFEKLVIYMKTCIQEILYQSGLKNYKLSHVILSDLTAHPLKKYLMSIIAESKELLEIEDEDKKYFEELFKKIVKGIELRNELIHNHWEIYLTFKGEHKDFAQGFRNKATKIGVSYFERKYQAADFDKVADEFEVLSNELVNMFKNIEDGEKVTKGLDLEALKRLELKLINK